MKLYHFAILFAIIALTLFVMADVKTDNFVAVAKEKQNLVLYDKNGLLDITKEQTVFTLDYQDLKTNEGYINFRSKRPNSFLLNDEDFYLIRKGSVISCIEDSMSYYCNRHNSIAQQFGITYNFAMPVVDNSEWTRSIDNPCIIVMFQGYPFGSGINDTYNRFVIAGARIKKNSVYYLEQKE